MRWYIDHVIRHRVVVIIIITLLTAGSGYQISRGVIGSSLLKLFFGESEKFERYMQRMETFGASDIMLVAYDDDALFTPAGFARLGRITAGLEALPDTERVDSLFNASRLRNTDDELVVEQYGDLVAATPTAAAALKRDVLQDDLLAGLVVSNDGTTAAFAIEFTSDADRPAESFPALIAQALACFEAEGIPKDKLHLAGLLPESSEATRVAQVTMVQIFPVTCLALILIVLLLFRRIWPVTITLAVALISVAWAVAFAIAIDRQVNMMIAAVPAVTMIMCFSDIIHLCSAYMLLIDAGVEKDEAIRQSGTEVGLACLFTSLTTFVGFVSLSFVPTPAFRQLGLVLGFGVAVALLLALTLVPIFFSYLGAPSVRARTSGRSIVDRCTYGMFAFATHAPKITIAGFAVVAGVSVYGVSQLQIETNFLERLDSSNPLRQSREYLKGKFSGTNAVDIFVRANAVEGLNAPAAVAALDRAQRRIAEVDGVDRVGSIVDVYSRIGDAMGTPRIPSTREGLAQYLLLFEVSGGSGLERIIDSERQLTRVVLNLATGGFVTTAAIGDRATEILTEELGSAYTIEPSGLTYLFGDWVGFVIDGQKRGLGFALLATTFMMLLCLRSLRVGVLSMIPNLLPLLVLGGFVTLVWDTVDSDVSLIAMIAIGIGVDDTIHFLTRFRLESMKTDDVHRALERTFSFTGRAIVQTTVILAVGFSPFILSEYFSTRIMGTLLPMTLVVALLADLLLVPAMVQVGVIRFRRG